MDGGDFLFTVVPFFIGFVFILIFGIIIFSLIKSISQWQKNERSPSLSVTAVVKTMRTQVSHHDHHNDNHISHSTDTTYYATFEFESGDRSEFDISGKEYGQLAEGDSGVLSFQGTRYLGFERRYENEA
jgi:hypothetical protein